MSKPSKASFQFNKASYKKFWNRVDLPTRYFYIFAGCIILASPGVIREGFKNNDFVESRQKWLKTKVRNTQLKEFDYLDEEAAPVPLEKKSGIEQFRAEFDKIK